MDFIGQNMDKRVLHEQQIQTRLNERKLMLQECKVQEVKAADASSGNTNNNGIVSYRGNANSSENDCSKTWNDQSSWNQSSTHGNESSRSGKENNQSGNICSERSNSGDDTNIIPSYDTEPMAEVPNSADYNVFAVEKQHTEQPEYINDTYVMEKNDSNVTSDSSDMSHNVKKVDQHVVEPEDKCVLLASLISNLKLDVDENKKIQKQLKKANTSLTQELEKSKQDLEKSKQDLFYCKSELAKYKNFQTNHKDKEKDELECAKSLGLLVETKRLHDESLKTQSYETFCIKEENAKLVTQISIHERRISQILKEKEQIKKDFKAGEDKEIDRLIALENQVNFLNNIVYKTGQYVKTIHMLTPKPSSYYTSLGSRSFANPKYLEKAQLVKPCLYNVKYDKNDLANLFAPESEETIRLAEESRSKLYMLIPLAQDTKSNASLFETHLKTEMFADLKYVQSLEKEVDELQSDKTEFSKEYDLLLQECVSKDIMCAIFRSFDNIDEQIELQCLYLEKCQECECLENELSKQNENVKNKSFNELSKRFSELEKHCISLELSSQQRNERFQNDKPCKNQDAPEFPEFFEINEFWNKMKGKGVNTNFGKPSILGKPPLQPIRNQPVVRQPNAFRSERSSFLKTQFASQVVAKKDFIKPVTPHSWSQVRQSAFAKPHHVTAPGPSRHSSKRVSFQSPKESVGSNDIVYNYYLEEAKEKAQIQKDKALNTKPSV
ncbi:hypothetical protein Tco_0973910 [Tanacetum coccineum]|uniref:Kinesin-like protein n=1 Tax=Tanacetum coccineum TaxID=301880 RepID=A0ABQ5EAA6_9ASTR